MDVIAEIQSHADECRRMAAQNKDGATKSTWTRLAERWERMLVDYQRPAKRSVGE